MGRKSVIWYALLIPFLFAAITWSLFNRRVVWWEVVLPFVVSLVFVFVSYELAVVSLTTDTEYWTAWVEKAEYYEPWTEQYTETETYTDSKGKQQTRTVTRHRHHAAQFVVKDSANISYAISRDRYRFIVNRFGNEKYEDIWRASQVSVGDGNKYYTVYPATSSRMVVSTTVHTYENRIQNSTAVFHFEQPKDITGLHQYPSTGDNINVPSILGGPTASIEWIAANEELCRRNAELGSKKQVRIWILYFPNMPLSKGLDQEKYWKGGNKNELVVCIGTDESRTRVKWAHVFAWENEKVKVDVRNFIREQDKLSLNSSVIFITDKVEKEWKRKRFSDFKYIAVKPPFWAVVTTIVLTIVINLGLSVFAVMNEYNPSGQTTIRKIKQLRR